MSPAAPHASSQRLAPWLVAIVVGLASPAASAHPHVWIDASVNLVFKSKKIAAMNVTWLFDEAYSAATVADYGKHTRGTMDASELATLVGDSTRSLAHYSYFTYLEVDGVRKRTAAVTDFHATLVHGRLVYRFTVPVAPPVDPVRQRFAFLLYDETYFVYVGLLPKGQGLSYSGDAPALCTDTRKQDLTTPLYFGYDYPTIVALSCQ